MSTPELGTPRKARPGDLVELDIAGLDERGRGRAEHEGQRFCVARAVPGSRVRARVLKRRRSDVEAIAIETLVPGPDAVAALCPYTGACGGCSFQELAYPAQLRGMHELVAAPLRARGLLTDVLVEPVIGAPDPWRYRNRMEFTFGARRWIDPSEPAGAPAQFALGLHARNLYSKVVDIHACVIQSAAADGIVASARELALEHGLEPWDVKHHTGLLRHLVLRVARATGEILVCLVTSRDEPERIEPYARAILARHPEITTFVHGVNSRLGATANTERERVLHGDGTIQEVLSGISFRISPASFFQTNSAQAERLFAIVREEAALCSSDVLWDLYCGAGSFALVLASAARETIGFELVAAAVADARANAERNGISNARFVEGDVLLGLGEAAVASYPSPDVCIVDPPRAGLHPKLVPRLAALPARRIVYVSCNPRSAANDLAELAVLGWRLVRARPIDLFPHTPHVECVFTLERGA